MDRVYLIVAGEYSDYAVFGFFTNKEEAEKYCAYKNSADEYRWYEYSVEECGNLENGFFSSDIEVKYEYVFNFSEGGNIQQRYAVGPVLVSKGESRIETKDHKHTPVTIYVCLPENNREKAEKIAHDMYAKYKAEQQGI